ncbi:class I SAM-dependent methyltransferase [Thalassobius sp. I31.1]|uniref:class I SAM-dependent methyltransferase n=1 Tax=Thalassobius sp. I31.1 TaxID=2109912 RepID=UPI001300B4B6|nr:class I SAM-dependent methyltransferase [Thalassobius sp. I31.1]
MQNFDLKEEIRSYWSDQAIHFDKLPAHQIEKRYGVPEWKNMLRAALQLEADGDLEGMEALDIACGTGEISQVLCGLHAKVTGIDFAGPMLDAARQKLRGKAWTGLHADAENPFVLEDHQFDIAITRHLCWTLVDPQLAYASWFRVLKPRGQLIVIDGNWSQTVSRWQRIRNWIAGQIDTNMPASFTDSQRHSEIVSRLPYSEGLSANRLRHDLERVGFTKMTEIDISALYSKGMDAWSLAERLRQTSENRFGVIAEKPAE